MPARTFYEILRISPTATDEEIKAAYRALAWNPAGAGGQDELKLINEAYATLSSPGRRAAYDEALAGGGAAAAVAPVTAPAQARMPVIEPEPIPKGPPLLRLWGQVTEIALQISRVRYVIIPFTWILCGMLVGFCFYLIDGYQQTVKEPTPTKTSIHAIMQGIPDHKYVAVVGYADYENGYESKGDVDKRYYVLLMDKEILLFTGPKLQGGGQFTGLLRPFEGKMADLVKKDAADPYWTGYTLQTTHYLDTEYKPPKAGWFFLGFLAVLVGFIVLIVPGLKRYTVFVAEPPWSNEPLEGEAALPIPVEATGRFRPAEGRGFGKFEALHSSQLFRDGAGFAVVTWFKDRPYRIAIPRGSQARAGFDHTGGQTRPALKIRAGGQSIVLRMASLTDARRLAREISA
ncbi:MAG TPA: J domain-containing protein [Symbiobacteriaceae bacterium]|nr:J domain-containing protein [Symbiobacteriaceae bacterium]